MYSLNRLVTISFHVLGLSKKLPEYNNRVRDFINQDKKYSLALKNKVCRQIINLFVDREFLKFTTSKYILKELRTKNCSQIKKATECPVTAADPNKNNVGKFRHLLERVTRRTFAVEGKPAEKPLSAKWPTFYKATPSMTKL